MHVVFSDTNTDLRLNKPGESARKQAKIEYSKSVEQHGKVVTFIGKIFSAHTTERSWRVGADGEESIGDELNKLRTKNWTVLHAVPVGVAGSDIDHVLVSPKGTVYTVNSKHHPSGTVWVGKNTMRLNNTSVPYIRNSIFEASRSVKLLKNATNIDIVVRPLIILRLGEKGVLRMKDQPKDVIVLRAGTVVKKLNSEIEVTELNKVEHEILITHAIQSSTWTKH